MIQPGNDPYDRVFKMALVAACFLVCLITPLKIGGFGYLPSDDALRHSAFAMDNRLWSEVLVFDASINPSMDAHPGWHGLLRFVHENFHLNQDGLVVFSFVLTFAFFSLTGLVASGNALAWMITCAVILVVDPGFLGRLLLGRPFVISMAALVALLFLWTRPKAISVKWESLLVILALTLAIAAHPTVWYLWSLPGLALIICRQIRSAVILAAAVPVSMGLAGLITGGWYDIFVLPLSLLPRVFGMDYLVVTNLVTELRPRPMHATILLLVAGVLISKSLLKLSFKSEWKGVDFWLFVIGALLGLKVGRFWLDWGCPAMMVWLCRQIGLFGSVLPPMRSSKWFIVGLLACMFFYFGVTADVDGRYTRSLKPSLLRRPVEEFQQALPDPGGILYSADMMIFYQLYYRLPHEKFRFELGFEPGLMPDSDMAVLRSIQFTEGLLDEYQPWFLKMNPADRVVLSYPEKPKWPGMEFAKFYGYWIGRRIGPVDKPDLLTP